MPKPAVGGMISIVLLSLFLFGVHRCSASLEPSATPTPANCDNGATGPNCEYKYVALTPGGNGKGAWAALLGLISLFAVRGGPTLILHISCGRLGLARAPSSRSAMLYMVRRARPYSRGPRPAAHKGTALRR